MSRVLLLLAVLSLAAGCANAGPPGPLLSPADPTRALSNGTPTGVGMQAPPDED